MSETPILLVRQTAITAEDCGALFCDVCLPSLARLAQLRLDSPQAAQTCKHQLMGSRQGTPRRFTTQLKRPLAVLQQASQIGRLRLHWSRQGHCLADDTVPQAPLDLVVHRAGELALTGIGVYTNHAVPCSSRSTIHLQALVIPAG